MARMANEAAGLPPHMRAVFYRQFARDAEAMAHKCLAEDTRDSYRQLAEQWRLLAEQMDAISDPPDFAGSDVHPLNVSYSHRMAP
jgi:hypothetical protein